jgi:hypothetical protein
MGWGRVAGTELMPNLVGGNTETVCSKLKSGNRFLKPNFELVPKLRQARLPTIAPLADYGISDVATVCIGKSID